MKENVKSKIDLFVENKEILRKGNKFESELMTVASSLVYTSARVKVDIEKFKECRKILKKKAGMFSSFRSTSELMVVSKMAIADNPEKYIDDIQAIYKVLTKGTLSDSGYFILAAMSIYETHKIDDRNDLPELVDIINNQKDLFKKLNKKHPILTSTDDVPFQMLGVLEGKEVDVLFEEIEEGYNYLKKDYKKDKVDSGMAYNLSQVLAASRGDIKEKCDKAMQIYKAFAAHGTKYGKSYEFTSLGALVDIDEDVDKLVEEIIEANEYLEKKKGFGNWSLGATKRLMFAAMLVADEYDKDVNVTGSAALTGTLATIIAEQVALMMVVILAASAAASSNN